MHVKNPQNAELRKAMNPLKPPENETAVAREKRMLRLNDFCVKCHDLDNDTTWKIEKWEKIIHRTPE